MASDFVLDNALQIVYVSHSKGCSQDFGKNGMYRIWYIEKGIVDFLTSTGQKIIANKGDFVYIPNGTACKAFFEKDDFTTVLKLNFRFFPNTSKFDYQFQKITNYTKNLVKYAYEIPYYTTENICKSFWTFYRFINECEKNLKHNDSKKIAKILPALDYMNSNDIYDVPLLAKICNMSESRFYAVFKEIYGLTPIEAKHEKQALKAERLLTFTNLSIDEIAKIVGFKSTQHFREVFKKRYSTTPNKIRKNWRSNH